MMRRMLLARVRYPFLLQRRSVTPKIKNGVFFLNAWAKNKLSESTRFPEAIFEYTCTLIEHAMAMNTAKDNITSSLFATGFCGFKINQENNTSKTRDKGTVTTQ